MENYYKESVPLSPLPSPLPQSLFQPLLAAENFAILILRLTFPSTTHPLSFRFSSANAVLPRFGIQAIPLRLPVLGFTAFFFPYDSFPPSADFFKNSYWAFTLVALFFWLFTVLYKELFYIKVIFYKIIYYRRSLLFLFIILILSFALLLPFNGFSIIIIFLFFSPYFPS